MNNIFSAVLKIIVFILAIKHIKNKRKEQLIKEPYVIEQPKRYKNVFIVYNKEFNSIYQAIKYNQWESNRLNKKTQPIKQEIREY